MDLDTYYRLSAIIAHLGPGLCKLGFQLVLWNHCVAKLAQPSLLSRTFPCMFQDLGAILLAVFAILAVPLQLLAELVLYCIKSQYLHCLPLTDLKGLLVSTLGRTTSQCLHRIALRSLTALRRHRAFQSSGAPLWIIELCWTSDMFRCCWETMNWTCLLELHSVSYACFWSDHTGISYGHRVLAHLLEIAFLRRKKEIGNFCCLWTMPLVLSFLVWALWNTLSCKKMLFYRCWNKSENKFQRRGKHPGLRHAHVACITFPKAGRWRRRPKKERV